MRKITESEWRRLESWRKGKRVGNLSFIGSGHGFTDVQIVPDTTPDVPRPCECSKYSFFHWTDLHPKE